MNNLKKIGLSALAGSLASVSAHAAEVSVSGSASITMDRVNKHLVTGNDFSMGDSLGFNMSGETDGGLGVAVYYEIDGGSLDDYDMTLSGDWGTLKFNGSGSSSALGAVDDVTPNAYEEAWDILDTDGTATSGSSCTYCEAMKTDLDSNDTEHVLIYALTKPYTVTTKSPKVTMKFGTAEALSASDVTGTVCNIWAEEPVFTATIE